MNAFARTTMHQEVQGMCQGTINGTETFNASLVELSEVDFPNHPPPHGKAHVMLATQMAPGPDYTTKEVRVSFSMDMDDAEYGLGEDSYPVGVLFIDRSDPAVAVVYKQIRGIARLAYDASSATLSGTLCADVENNDENNPSTLTLKMDFIASARSRTRRNPRRPSARVGTC